MRFAGKNLENLGLLYIRFRIRSSQFGKNIRHGNWNRFDGDASQSQNDTAQDGQTEIKKSESRGQDPNVDNGDESKDNGP